MFVLECLEVVSVTRVENEVDEFFSVFEDTRPLLLQINSPNGEKIFYVKDYMTKMVTRFAYTGAYQLIRMLENHGRFNGDILTASMSKISEEAVEINSFANSVTCLRVMNLFKGGCRRILPSKFQHRIHHHLKAHFAFIDFPFELAPAVDLAWQLKRYDLVETFIARDCPFRLTVQKL